MNESNYITRLINEITLDPDKIVDEIIAKYRNLDFKKVIFDMSQKTKISKFKLVQMYCDKTGTDSGNLPGGYTLSDFMDNPPSKTVHEPEKVEAPEKIPFNVITKSQEI
jgi:hypothetical protein